MKMIYTKKEIIVDGEGDFILAPLKFEGETTFIVKNFQSVLPLEDKNFVLKCLLEWYDKRFKNYGTFSSLFQNKGEKYENV